MRENRIHDGRDDRAQPARTAVESIGSQRKGQSNGNHSDAASVPVLGAFLSSLQMATDILRASWVRGLFGQGRRGRYALSGLL